MERLYKLAFGVIFNVLTALFVAFVVMILLNQFFPVLSYGEWLLWSLAGLAIVNGGLAINDFNDSLDNITKR